jgi:hypothetical protein
MGILSPKKTSGKFWVMKIDRFHVSLVIESNSETLGG